MSDTMTDTKTNTTTDGIKHDAGKPRWSLIPWRGLARVVDVLEFGARKYAPGNWRKVNDAQARYTDALLRHVVAYAGGEIDDPESGLHHLAHAGCCVLFLLEIAATDAATTTGGAQ